MLDGAGEAHNAAHERVIPAVSRATRISREQLVETMRRLLPTALRHIEPQSSQPWRHHREKQRRLALAPGEEIGSPLSHELATGKV